MSTRLEYEAYPQGPQIIWDADEKFVGRRVIRDCHRNEGVRGAFGYAIVKRKRRLVWREYDHHLAWLLVFNTEFNDD